MIPNQTVTFYNPKTNLYINDVAVQIYYASGMVRLDPYAAAYQWTVKWPSALAYEDGQTVQRDHQIIWDGLDEPGHRATLKRPRVAFGSLPFSTAYFSEMSPG